METFCSCSEQSLLKTNDNRISDDTHGCTHKTRIQNGILLKDMFLSVHVHTRHRRECSRDLELTITSWTLAVLNKALRILLAMIIILYNSEK
jgi:hypothetical protein